MFHSWQYFTKPTQRLALSIKLSSTTFLCSAYLGHKILLDSVLHLELGLIHHLLEKPLLLNSSIAHKALLKHKLVNSGNPAGLRSFISGNTP